MKSIIQNRLKDIEITHGIKILYACESGSRAWGFPSPDSDYDIRFIYKKSIESYLSIKEEADFINFPLSDELDINGWDLKKTLGLISKSNAVPFEWLQSPIIYYEETDFAKELFTLCQPYFCRRTFIQHYLGIARGAKENSNNGEIGVKKLFYILRPLLAALWCVENNNIPPMEIMSLIKLIPDELRKEILLLIEMKASCKERFEINLDNHLKIWIEDTFQRCLEYSKDIEKRDLKIDALNNYFIKEITK